MTYSQLTSIPLFTGISGDDLAIIMDKVELVEAELTPGEVLVEAGDVCHCMAILREGTLNRSCKHNAGTFVNARKQTETLEYKVTELVEAPLIIEPEILYGLEQQHLNTWKAHSTCHFTLIGKDDIRQTMMYVNVWRINFLNMLCTRMQKFQANSQVRPAEDSRQRLLDFLMKHTTQNSSSMTLDITIEQLAAFLGIGRRQVSSLIDELSAEGVIEKQMQRIVVPATDKLLTHYTLQT